MRALSRSILAALWLLALPAAALAQGTGSIRGTVVDAATQRPLQGVQVVVQGSTLGVLSDAQGAFQIANVPAGERVVRASMVGFGAREARVTVAARSAMYSSLSTRTSTARPSRSSPRSARPAASPWPTWKRSAG